jgi:hypothetical protein
MGCGWEGFIWRGLLRLVVSKWVSGSVRGVLTPAVMCIGCCIVLELWAVWAAVLGWAGGLVGLCWWAGGTRKGLACGLHHHCHHIA